MYKRQGYFGAGRFIPCDELTAGMVGYITASIKNVRDTRAVSYTHLDVYKRQVLLLSLSSLKQEQEWLMLNQELRSLRRT